MTDNIFTDKDIKAIKKRGTTPEAVLAQIESFKKGFPHVSLIRPCTLNDGLKALPKDELARLGRVFDNARRDARAMKFVPASGAASRMFKDLLSGYYQMQKTNRNIDLEALKALPDGEKTAHFIDNLEKFAFYHDLKAILTDRGMDIDKLKADGQWGTILDYTLTSRGINLAGQPKGMIKFHRYHDHSRTPLEEHLVEAMRYARDGEGLIRIHFTLAPEHLEQVQNHLIRAVLPYDQEGSYFEITHSIQKPATDTVAVDLENNPFRDSHGRILFRPGGHGALLENLNDLQGDIIFIKNIDNIVPDFLKKDTTFYKKALGGYLIETQEKIFHFLRGLEQGDLNDAFFQEILTFAKERLSLSPPEWFDRASDQEKREFLYKRLNRPLRVCGMVKNESEPGGGPFWVKQPAHTPSLQIIESDQVDMSSKEQKDIWRSSIHFNPVDLVCGVRDYKDRPFDLMKYRDPETGFISLKSMDGRELKALELPGLWNGSMAFWNTVFIEVPLITFNPVKTVFDLLRREHQPQ